MAGRNEIRDRYRQVCDQVAQAAERSGRRAQDVMVVAVTKYAGVDQIRQLLELGHQDLGENRVQQLQQRVAMTEEFLARHRILTSPRKMELPDSVRWHMIGHLQRNKVKVVLPLVKLIHSVDSLRLAEELQVYAARRDCDADILIQVNTSGEKSKGGVSLPAAPHLIDQIQTMLNVRVRGLMTMAPLTDDTDEIRSTFARTAEMFHEMRAGGAFGPKFNILSMGMSGDYLIAIECGANLVRIGRAIFGEPEIVVPEDSVTEHAE
ncbi:MAG: YggS family pyridoxal phosphate-dependent enzyme [Phycisphaeraceae bacterium]